jgi:capsular exopolysaccharide synthesis family protein
VAVLLCCLLVPGAALAYSLSQEKQYTASASLLFRDPGFDQKLFGSQVFEQTDPNREAATNVTLVSLETVGARAARRLGVASVKSKVHVKAEGQSNVVAIDATDPKPRRAALIANTFAAEYIAFRRHADQAKIADARRLIEQRMARLGQIQGGDSAEVRALRDRLGQLQVLESLQTGNAELAQRATVPTSPSSPRIVLNTLLGAILGLILGIGLAFLLERLDRRVRDPHELEELFDRPVLTAVPRSRSLAGRGPSAGGRLAQHEREAFRMLRANLRYFNIDRDIKSVLVTSAAPGDGKTSVAWNLSVAGAAAGSKVLLIEADLRHPGLAGALGTGIHAGLSNVLSGEAQARDVIQQVPVTERQNGHGPRTVDVIFSGPLPPNPTDLLESTRMRDLISAAEQAYDLVVIDTPPTSVVSDAVPLVNEVGGVIVVGRMSQSTRDAMSHLRNQLVNLDAPVLGVVANALNANADGYGYGYAYTYGPQGESRSRGR